MRSGMSGPLRVALVCPRYQPFIGGVESHVEHLAQRMAAAGHVIEVITQGDDTSLPPVEVLDRVTVRRFPIPISSRHYPLAPALWHHLRRRRGHDDVVHAHGYHNLTPLAALVAGCRPLVFTPHYHGTGHSPFRKLLHPPYRPIGARILQAASRVICVSEPEARLILEHFPHVAGRLQVIPNGVDVDAIQAARPYDQQSIVVLSAGRLEAYKQVDLTVRAVAHLNARFVLHVTGDGPERPRLQQLAAQLGLGNRVQFLGTVSTSSLHRWYRTASSCVSMSTNEAQSVTILESLAAGASVVASDIPAHRDLQRRIGGNIQLLPVAASPGELARAIAASSLKSQSGSAAVPTWEQVADQTMDVYRAVVSVSADADHG
jgi:glycosyltransferase involved in cell wall biosynthesis